MGSVCTWVGVIMRPGMWYDIPPLPTCGVWVVITEAAQLPSVCVHQILSIFKNEEREKTRVFIFFRLGVVYMYMWWLYSKASVCQCALTPNHGCYCSKRGRQINIGINLRKKKRKERKLTPPPNVS